MNGLRAIASSLVLLLALAANAEPNPRGVWMMDTVDDTGLEPDPATAAQDMWKSPSIWIRNADDGGLIHQNPVYGQTNYVYVKLRREVVEGKEPIEGELELYYANASTGLDWKSQWTLIDKLPVSILNESELIVKFPWDPAGKGHFCLVARWSSPEDQPHDETTNIDSNTRLNNNVVWRNLNVIDLHKSLESFSTIIVRNVDEGIRGINLAFRVPRMENARPFVGKQGRVVIRLDEQLFRRWEEMGAMGDGFERVGDFELEVVNPENAMLFGIPMKLGEEFPVEIRFERFEWAEPGVFHFDAVQLQKDGKETGGVGYEIRTVEEPQQLK